MSPLNDTPCPTVGDNGGPPLSITEKLEDLVEATLDAALSRVKSPECNGSDLNAAAKIISQFNAADFILNQKATEERRIENDAFIDDLPAFDEHGNFLSDNKE